MTRKTVLALALGVVLLLGLGIGAAAFGHSATVAAHGSNTHSQQSQKTEDAQGQQTIVGVALAVNAKSGEFSTLIAALQCTGLVPALNGDRQYTVFAPTDAAFAKLGLNKSNVCAALPKATLTNILLYHVATGVRDSAAVLDSTHIRMLNGEFTTISVRNGAPYINDSKIIAVDVFASNGVIHIIDSVLLP